jgi:hypothetical protein
MEQLQMLKYMIKKARLDFIAAWKCEGKDLELENKWQDLGFSGCEQNTPNSFNHLLDLLSDEDGNSAVARESGAEDFEFSDLDSDDSDDWLSNKAAQSVVTDKFILLVNFLLPPHYYSSVC